MVGAWIKKNGGGWELGGYTRTLEKKEVEWDGDDNVKNMWEQIKRTMVESAKEVWSSVRVGGRSPKSVWWNDEIKATVKRKEAAWKRMLAASDEDTKIRCMKAHREEEKG